MKNFTLDYLSVLHWHLESLAADVDQQLVNADDGEYHGVREGKEKFHSQLDAAIKSLQELKREASYSAAVSFLKVNGI